MNCFFRQMTFADPLSGMTGVESTSSPMQVDALTQRGNGPKGKGKGKDKGDSKNRDKNDWQKGSGKNKDKEKERCPHCGRVGHWKRDCWYAKNDSNASQGKGGPKRISEVSESAGSPRGTHEVSTAGSVRGVLSHVQPGYILSVGQNHQHKHDNKHTRQHTHQHNTDSCMQEIVVDNAADDSVCPRWFMPEYPIEECPPPALCAANDEELAHYGKEDRGYRRSGHRPAAQVAVHGRGGSRGHLVCRPVHGEACGPHCVVHQERGLSEARGRQRDPSAAEEPPLGDAWPVVHAGAGRLSGTGLGAARGGRRSRGRCQRSALSPSGVRPPVGLCTGTAGGRARDSAHNAQPQHATGGGTHSPCSHCTSWCEICAQARGRDACHKANPKMDALVPVIELDYAGVGAADDPYNNFRFIAVVDTSTGMPRATAVCQKGRRTRAASRA